VHFVGIRLLSRGEVIRAADFYSLCHVFLSIVNDFSDTFTLFRTFAGLAGQLLESACDCEVLRSTASDWCCVCAYLSEVSVLLICGWCAVYLSLVC